MRVLQLIQKPQLRGAEIFACQLSEELACYGVTSDVAFLFGEENNVLNFNLKFHALGAIQQRRFSDFSGYKNLAELVRSGQYEIVQANAGDTLKYAIISKLLYRWRTPVVFRNANKMSDFIKNPYQKWFNKWLLGKCRFVVSVSENCRQDILTIIPSLKNRSITIPIGTKSFELVEPIARPNPDEPFFVSIGSLVPEKNHVFLIDVFHEFIKGGNKGHLWIIGEGHLRAMLEDRIQALGLNDRIKLPGAKNNVLSYLKASDALMMPSLIEGLPGVILEALSCRIPVISASVGGIPEVINEDTGQLIRNSEISAYLKAMEDIIQNSSGNKWRNRVIAGERLVREHYTMPIVTHSFFQTYRRIID
ncbi:MAG TPA: glycosyltransferase [Cyclobacteriaceae bacterium]|nr:glycosyltransferase [Cyclobacteriaceae bacterium]